MAEPVEKKETELSGAEQIELAKLRAETAAHQKRTAELEAQNRDLTMKDTISKSIAGSGIKSHHSDGDLYKLLSSQDGVKVVPSADGTELHIERDGKPTTMKDLIETYAVQPQHQHEFDRRTLRHLVDSGSEAITSKEQLTTQAEKIAYIAKNGADAYERLGRFKVPSLDASKLTATDWSHLTIAQKTQVVEQHGQNVVSKILRRK